jgi:glyoxylase-like metal-dependent hydrolase (beta-lactamase superfamily II)
MTVIKQSIRHAVTEIQAGLWRIEFYLPSPTNCWLWQESDGLTLIDAAFPQSAKAIMEAISLIGQPLKRIVITHAHPDHAGAAAELSCTTGAKVFAHEADVPYMQGHDMSELPGFWMCRTMLKFGKQLGILSPPPVDSVEVLAHGDEVGRLKVIHTPGHTPGSISLYAPEAQAMFCGDNLLCDLWFLRVGLPWFTLDPKTQRKSLEVYSTTASKVLLSGHGGVLKGDVCEKVRRLLN